MDSRDRYLNRHMQKRIALARPLPLEKQRQWATKCMQLASIQHRTAFYMMSSLWLSELH